MRDAGRPYGGPGGSPHVGGTPHFRHPRVGQDVYKRQILGMAGYDSQQARQIIHDFRQRHQATDCTTLLTLAKEQGIPRKDHCDALVFEMAELLEEIFASKGE